MISASAKLLPPFQFQNWVAGRALEWFLTKRAAQFSPSFPLRRPALVLTFLFLIRVATLTTRVSAITKVFTKPP